MANLIEIKRYGYNGEGVGEIDGKITFVPFSLPNEVCECEVVKEDKSYQTAASKPCGQALTPEI